MGNRPPKNEKRPVYPNEHEEKCALQLEEQGYKVTKRGWPDLICWRGGKKDERGVIFVEVKPTREPLRRSQAYMMNVLSKAGFKCFRWDPKDGLKPWDDEDQIAREKRVRLARYIKAGAWPDGRPMSKRDRERLIADGVPGALTAWERETSRTPKIDFIPTRIGRDGSLEPVFSKAIRKRERMVARQEANRVRRAERAATQAQRIAEKVAQLDITDPPY